MSGRVWFVGAGPGAADLLTLRAARVLGEADVIVWARSLVDPEVLTHARPEAELVPSDDKTFDDVLAIYRRAAAEGLGVARVHSGDPTLYGTLNEQLRACRELGLECEIVPGVSSLGAAAAALGQELTIPDVSQSLILTRRAQRTSMPANEELAAFAAHGTTMALFLSVRRPRELQADLLAGGYAEDTPCAVVYRASWPDEIVIRCPLAELGERVARRGSRPRRSSSSGLPSARDVGRSHVYDAGYGHRHRPLGRPDRYRSRRVSGRIVVLGVAGGRVPPGTEALLERADVVAGGGACSPRSRRTARVTWCSGRGSRRRSRRCARSPATCACWRRAIPASSGSSRAFGDAPLEIHPAPSSVALAFARLGLSWDDAVVVSAHARDPRPAIHTALRHPKVAILTDDNAAEIVAALDGRRVTVAEALGTPAERVGERAALRTAQRRDRGGRRTRAARDSLGAARGRLRAPRRDDHEGRGARGRARCARAGHRRPGVGRRLRQRVGRDRVRSPRRGGVGIDDDPHAIELTTRNAATHDVPVRIVPGQRPGSARGLPEPDATFVGGGGDRPPRDPRPRRPDHPPRGRRDRRADRPHRPDAGRARRPRPRRHRRPTLQANRLAPTRRRPPPRRREPGHRDHGETRVTRRGEGAAMSRGGAETRRVATGGAGLAAGRRGEARRGGGRRGRCGAARRRRGRAVGGRGRVQPWMSADEELRALVDAALAATRRHGGRRSRPSTGAARSRR